MLILLNENYLQALERTIIYNSWITIVLLVLFAIVFLLKGMHSTILKGYVFSIFNKGFVEMQSAKRTVFFKPFYGLIFMFSVVVLALIFYHFINDFGNVKQNNIFLFLKIVAFVFIFYAIKFSIEYLLSVLFLIKTQVRFFLVSKITYLYTISIMLFCVLILFEYTGLNTKYLYIITMLLFLIRFTVHFLNNKNLIFNKLFYFILYLCAFEIAPLFFVVKLLQ